MIRIENLKLSYRTAQGEVPAVRGLSLAIAKGEFYTLLGPSGCGKTTTLRCVAGLEYPNHGLINLGDETVFSAADRIRIPPYDRNIGMVFQSYAIWPHMTVFDNVAFPLKQLGGDRRKRLRERVMQALSLVKLEDYADRPAPYLSGGQQQRLALARALVREPEVLLLDEPLSNLDAKLREQMRFELRELVKTLNVTTLFVTHEQIEALTMSDRIGVMNDGLLIQEGTPSEIYRDPRHSFVADFIGKSNFLRGRISSGKPEKAGRIITVETPIGLVRARSTESLDESQPVLVAIRPEHVKVAEDVNEESNVFEGTVRECAFLGNLADCIIDVADTHLNAQLHPDIELNRGETLTIAFAVRDCMALQDEEAVASSAAK